MSSFYAEVLDEIIVTFESENLKKQRFWVPLLNKIYCFIRQILLKYK